MYAVKMTDKVASNTVKGASSLRNVKCVPQNLKQMWCVHLSIAASLSTAHSQCDVSTKVTYKG